MSAPRLHVCPACLGPRLFDDVLGPRFRHHSGCPFRDRELEQQAADVETVRRRGQRWSRPVTFVEREFLVAAGFELADDAECEVLFLTPSLRKRVFSDRLGRVCDLDDQNVPAVNVAESAGAGEGAA